MATKNIKLAGVIDIGSHAVRLHIGEILRKGKIHILENLWVPIAIGKDTFANRTISNQTISELLRILKNFKKSISTYKLDNVKTVATSALREASNAGILVERVQNLTGFQIEIIDTMDETWILYNALKNKMKKKLTDVKKNIFILMVGGGSTRMIYIRNGRIVFTETFHFGTLRAQEIYTLHYDSFHPYIQSQAFKLNDILRSYQQKEIIQEFIAVNDDALNLVRNLPLATYSEKTGVYRLQRKVFMKYFDEILPAPDKKVGKKYSIDENNLISTMISFYFIGHFFRIMHTPKILFSEIGFSNAILCKMSSKGKRNPAQFNIDERKNIISAVETINYKYKNDIPHAFQVRKLALIIFDTLRERFGFLSEERLLLEVAALLHDIGKFISFKSHHKHSEVLIRAFEILGLNKTDMNIIAQIARYHRRSLPRDSHQSYIKLSEKKRLLVSRMGAILRLADGLDRTPLLSVKNLKLAIQDDTCRLLVRFTEDSRLHFEFFSINAKSKSDFFEKFFGMNVLIEHQDK